MAIIRAMLFDIGGTLGDVQRGSLTLDLYSDTRAVLDGARALGLRLGIITNVLPDVDKLRVMRMLAEAGILDLFEAAAIVTSTEAATFKPNPSIYRAAMRAMDLPAECFVFVGDDPAEVAGAIAAGMQGLLKN